MKELISKYNIHKNIFILSLFIFSSISYAQEISWITFNSAMERIKKDPKPILIDVYTNWCGPCKYMDKITFDNKDVIKYINEHFYAVKFNGEGNESVSYMGRTYENPNYKTKDAYNRNSTHQFTTFLLISGYPTIIFMDKRGNTLLPITGVSTPDRIEFFLKLIATEKYLNFEDGESLEKYKNSFVPTFKS